MDLEAVSTGSHIFFFLKSKKVLKKISELHLNKVWGGANLD